MAKAPRPTLRLIDRFVLLVAWLVTCGLVYVLGYYVGKWTPERHAAMEERAVRLPVTSEPPAEGQRPKEVKEFPTFYQALPSGERPIDVARGTPVTAPPPTAVPPATLPPPTSYPSTSTTLAHPPPPPPALPHPGSTTTAPPASLAPPHQAVRGGFTVEASPTRSRSDAEQQLVSLRKRGYDATLVQVQRDGDTWYRLRVGRYATAEQANDVMRKLRDSEGVTHAFVAAE